MITWLAVLVFLLGSIHLMARLWLWHGIRKVSEREPNMPASARLPPLSVVIAARNESDNLIAYLPTILNQDYPQFEVVVALDRCSDASEEILNQFQADFSNLHYCSIHETPDGWAPKKWALAQAIDLAQYEVLVCTDADCYAEAHWLKSHGHALIEDADISLGLGMYTSYPGLLNVFIRYETSYTAFQYIGAAGQGKAYMGVGRNLAYKKEMYERSDGFVTFKQSLSGDDDLLINHHTKLSKTKATIRAGSWTWSEPKRTIGSFLRQKGRHFNASARYTASSKLALGLYHLSQIGFYSFLGLFLLTGGHIWGGACLYLVYLLGSWYIFGLFASEIKQTNLIVAYPLLDFMYACYHGIVAPFGLLAQPSWQKNQNQKYPKTPSRTENS